ncbi:MAG: PrsW family intramembrane metalloprotease [Anaerolineae bacterium]|nr:PrsW family intramembrane metalloprotease [Anaerolineae bacterium]
MALAASVLLSFIPAFIYAVMVYWMDRYEKEPKLLLGGVFLWGAVVAAGAAFILNTIFGITIFALTDSSALADLATGSISAPLFEESLKGMAVLIVFLIFRKEFDSVMDGIVYAGIAALGFAATENVLYLYERGFLEGGWEDLGYVFVLRVILGPWNHPFYTAFTGIGLAASRLNKNKLIKFSAPVIGWGVSLFTHAFHNSLASFAEGSGGLALIILVDWMGWIFMAAVILWAVLKEKKWIQLELREEVRQGVISAQQYRVASSAWKRGVAKWSGLGDGKYKATKHFYQLCTELAYKKHQFSRLGETCGNSQQMIDSLREETRKLAPKV